MPIHHKVAHKKTKNKKIKIKTQGNQKEEGFKPSFFI